MRALTLVPILLLAGCQCSPEKANIVDHNVMVTVPCRVTLPEKPVMPFTDTAITNDDIFIKTKKALAEIDLRKGYEAELEASAGACK